MGAAVAVRGSVESTQARVNPPPERFETERLRLRRPRLADAADVYEYASDPEVTRYLAFTTHRVVSTVEEFLRTLDTAAGQGWRYAWAITETVSDRLIGMLEIRIASPRGELGYVLAKRFWGRGYMAEALRPVVDWALRQKPIHRVEAFCDAENHGSARVLEKVGMMREGTLRKYFVHPNVSDVPRDCFLYSIVRE
jgi:[ribosomal protein S5]-alanine N-acetyltransferase